jgi:hypothetical protein
VENEKSKKSVQQAASRSARQRRRVEESESNSEVQLDSDNSSEVDEESEENNDLKEWQEKCYICKKGGNLICCDGCTQVAHVFCTGLRVKPTGDWHCEDCLYK